MTAHTKNLLGWFLAGIVGLLVLLATRNSESLVAQTLGGAAGLFGGCAVLVGGGNLILDLIQARDE